jgi:tRNA pseudouridine synthase 10
MLAVNDYEFNTFLIGATLPTQIHEQEDAIRARLKIRGRESIKNELTRELGLRLVRMTKRKADYMKPDITISLTVDKENNVDVAVKSRPVMLTGRYTKKLRGMPQKQDRCPHCEGKGCGSCDHSGLSGYNSVEGIIAKGLMAKTKGETPKFSWIGSEDQNSLVLASGRPFSVRIYNPKKRNLDKIRLKDEGVTATMSASEDACEPQARFIVKTRIHVKCENAIAKQDLKKLNSLAGADVNFKNRSKMATKKIYSAHARQLGSSGEFTLTIVADGGLMIKQFAGGEEYMKPNISEILNAKCECVTFDVLDVKLQ